MKKIWEKYYDLVMTMIGITFSLILGWLVVSSILSISSNLDRAFRVPSSDATKVKFDFTGLESLGLTANTFSVATTTIATTSTTKGEEATEEDE